MVSDDTGKRAKAILIAFIDDATRRIVYTAFTTSEHSLAFEKGLHHILASHGRIGRVYVDNGSTFVSTQTKRILNSTVDLEAVFFHEETRKVHKDSTVTLYGTLYEVPSVLIEEKVKLRFNPHLPTKRVFISADGKDYGECGT